jgi:hypothetical protein
LVPKDHGQLPSHLGLEVRQHRLAVLAPVLRGWELALWFTGANVALRGRRPVDLLGSNADAVLEAARYEAATGSW